MRIGTSTAAAGIVCVLAIGALHARADEPPVTVEVLAAPLRVASTLRRTTERCEGRTCSPTIESARVRIALHADGSAQLDADTERRTATHETRARTTWRGRASRTERGLSITLERVARASVTSAGYRWGPLPRPTDAPFVGSLSCAIVSVPVLPAIPALDERATPTPLVVCDWAEPVPLSEAFAGRWVLGADRGVYVAASGHLHVVRRAP